MFTYANAITTLNESNMNSPSNILDSLFWTLRSSSPIHNLSPRHLSRTNPSKQAILGIAIEDIPLPSLVVALGALVSVGTFIVKTDS